MAIGSQATLTVRDYGTDADDAELSRFRVPSYQIDAANLATWLTGWGTFKTTTDAIVLGVLAKEVVTLYNTALSSAIPVSIWANRELKLLVSFVGDTLGQEFQIEIPTPDLENLTLLANDKVELADGGIMAAWVAAFEAIARNPNDDSETVTVIGAEIVGRNL